MLLEGKNLKKVHTTRFGSNHAQAHFYVFFPVEQGKYVAIMGESGSGKATLLNILASLDKPTSGDVLLNGVSFMSIGEKRISAFRCGNLGFVFQDFNLTDILSVRDSIFLLLALTGYGHEEMESRLQPIANRLGITELLNKFPYEISGGQKQRSAVAREIITKPQLIQADEPTGALDSRVTESLLRLSYSVKAASHAGRVLFLQDGEVFHHLYKGALTTEKMYARISDTPTMLTAGGKNE